MFLRLPIVGLGDAKFALIAQEVGRSRREAREGQEGYRSGVRVEDAAERLRKAAEEEGIYLILGGDYERLPPA
jgi:hypothetical protein